MATTHIEAPPIVAVRPASGTPDRRDLILLALAFGSAATILFSIAVSQILLGVGLAGLLVWRKPIQFPRFFLPLALFFLLTLAAILASADPWRGAVQLRKFYVFGIVPLLYNTFRGVAHVRGLVIAWTLCGAVSALAALTQFVARWREAIILKAPLYDYVLDGRITGFQGHWMTFGGVQMIALLMFLAYLISGELGRWKLLGWTVAALIWLVLILGFTRSIFLAGVPAGATVLLWVSRRWLLLAVPALMTVLLLFPFATPIRERALSVLEPHGEVDSNSRRILMVRTGLRMIQAHPLLGLGPEQIEPQFELYIPKDAPRPLPKGWYGHLHNIFLQYAAERGIPALLCVLWMIARIAQDARHAMRASTPAAWVFQGVLAVIAAVLAEGLFEHNLGDSEVLTMFLATVTCGYAVLRSESAPPAAAGG